MEKLEIEFSKTAAKEYKRLKKVSFLSARPVANAPFHNYGDVFSESESLKDIR